MSNQNWFYQKITKKTDVTPETWLVVNEANVPIATVFSSDVEDDTKIIASSHKLHQALKSLLAVFDELDNDVDLKLSKHLQNHHADILATARWLLKDIENNNFHISNKATGEQDG